MLVRRKHRRRRPSNPTGLEHRQTRPATANSPPGLRRTADRQAGVESDNGGREPDRAHIRCVSYFTQSKRFMQSLSTTHASSPAFPGGTS